jgi:hypothetical protein
MVARRHVEFTGVELATPVEKVDLALEKAAKQSGGAREGWSTARRRLATWGGGRQQSLDSASRLAGPATERRAWQG